MDEGVPDEHPWHDHFHSPYLGTTALINAQKKKAAQKQTAMMVIHDINTTIESLEYSRDDFEKNYQSAQYFL